MTARLVVIALMFAAGAGLGRYTQPTGPLPPDLRGSVWALSLSDSHRVNCQFKPFRMVVDGRAEDIPGVPSDGDKWRIDLADGRISLYVAAIGPSGRPADQP